MTGDSPNARKPWLAVVLSLFSPGLGHLYGGQLTTALVLLLSSMLFAPATIVIAAASPSTALLIILLLVAVLVLGIYLYAVIDAYGAAKKAVAYEPKDYNRPLIYGLFFLVGVIYPAGSVFFLRASVFEAFAFVTASMSPNLLDGDRILVNKLALSIRPLQRGDLVAFHNPAQRQQTWVQRVIALPGDTVSVRSNDVFVNGKRLERERAPQTDVGDNGESRRDVYFEINAGRRYRIRIATSDAQLPEYPERTVPEGGCFVLGDNRNGARDSRDFGFVPLSDVLGCVQYVYCPALTWSRFGAYHD